MFIPSVCGGAAWTAEVNISSRSGVWGNQVSPHPRPREGLALKQGDGETWFPHPLTRREDLGGLRPPKKNLMFILFVCGVAVWTAEVQLV